MIKKMNLFILVILIMSFAVGDAIGADEIKLRDMYALSQYSYGHDIQVYGVGFAGPVLFADGAVEWNFSLFPILWVRKDGIARFDMQIAVTSALLAVKVALTGVGLLDAKPDSTFRLVTALVTLPHSTYKFRLRKNWQLTVGMNTHYLFINKAEQDRGVLLRPLIGMTRYSDHSFFGRGGWTLFAAYDNFWNWEGPSVSHGWSVGTKLFFEFRGH